ncbi:hypothetical protein TNCV_122371 [Trichonephila clavipes]|nr:hypothetical protein TNCV_122371 [Trichonephila clavipes]
MVKVMDLWLTCREFKPSNTYTHRVRERCTLNLSRAETSSCWCGMIVMRGRCRPLYLSVVQNYNVRRQSPRVAYQCDDMLTPPHTELLRRPKGRAPQFVKHWPNESRIHYEENYLTGILVAESLQNKTRLKKITDIRVVNTWRKYQVANSDEKLSPLDVQRRIVPLNLSKKTESSKRRGPQGNKLMRGRFP